MSTVKADNVSNLASETASMDDVVHGSARAWVTVAAVSGTPSISADYNVASITDDGVGLFTLNFDNALTDANYAISGNVDAAIATSVAAVQRDSNTVGGKTTSLVGITVKRVDPTTEAEQDYDFQVIINGN